MKGNFGTIKPAYCFAMKLPSLKGFRGRKWLLWLIATQDSSWLTWVQLPETGKLWRSRQPLDTPSLGPFLAICHPSRFFTVSFCLNEVDTALINAVFPESDGFWLGEMQLCHCQRPRPVLQCEHCFSCPFLSCLSHLNNQVKHSNRVWKCQPGSRGCSGLRIVVRSSCKAAGDKTPGTKGHNWWKEA